MIPAQGHRSSQDVSSNPQPDSLESRIGTCEKIAQDALEEYAINFERQNNLFSMAKGIGLVVKKWKRNHAKIARGESEDNPTIETLRTELTQKERHCRLFGNLCTKTKNTLKKINTAIEELALFNTFTANIEIGNNYTNRQIIFLSQKKKELLERQPQLEKFHKEISQTHDDLIEALKPLSNHINNSRESWIQWSKKKLDDCAPFLSSMMESKERKKS